MSSNHRTKTAAAITQFSAMIGKKENGKLKRLRASMHNLGNDNNESSALFFPNQEDDAFSLHPGSRFLRLLPPPITLLVSNASSKADLLCTLT